MEFIENILNSRFGNYIIMISVVVMFVVFLRLLYGPKGFLRKSLWSGIEDDGDDEDNKDDVNTTDNKNNNSNSNKN